MGEDGLTAVLTELEARKGSGYVGMLRDRIGSALFEEYVIGLQRQLVRSKIGEFEADETAVEVLADLGAVVDDILHEKEGIERGMADIKSDFPLLVLLTRIYSDKIPEPLRIRKGDYTIKLGMDPTNTSLHLGHLVPLIKLRDFMRLGYNTVPLLGTFTATIGDPSGRSEARPVLTVEQVMEYAALFEPQLRRILGGDAQFQHNHAWLQGMDLGLFMTYAGMISASKIESRPEFAQRRKRGEPISLREYIYPLLQAYDSVHLRALVEIGGTDQMGNMLTGRDLQHALGREEQMCLAMPLLPDTRGVRKMSKTSPDTCIFLSDAPNTMYGKLMSIPDSLIVQYFELLTDRHAEDVDKMRRALGDLDQIAKLGSRFQQHFGISDLIATRGEFLNIIREETSRYKSSVLVYAPDSKKDLSELVERLRAENFFVRTINSLAEAQAELSGRDYGVVIMDLSSKTRFEELGILRQSNETVAVLGVKRPVILRNGGDQEKLDKYKVAQVFDLVKGQLSSVINRMSDSVYRNITHEETPRREAIKSLQPLIFRIESALKRDVHNPDYSITIDKEGLHIMGNNDETRTAIDRLKMAENMGEDYHPMKLKHDLAYRVVELMYGGDAATTARAHFIGHYQQRGLSGNLPEYAVPTHMIGEGGVKIYDLARAILDPSISNSEIRRLGKQRAIAIRYLESTEWTRVGADHIIPASDLGKIAVRIGKHYAGIPTNVR